MIETTKYRLPAFPTCQTAVAENIIDLSNCKWLTDCPAWWQNFVSHAIPDPDAVGDSTLEISKKLKEHGGRLYSDRAVVYPGIQQVIFKTKEDLECFKLYWMLMGRE